VAVCGGLPVPHCWLPASSWAIPPCWRAAHHEDHGHCREVTDGELDVGAQGQQHDGGLVVAGEGGWGRGGRASGVWGGGGAQAPMLTAARHGVELP